MTAIVRGVEIAWPEFVRAHPRWSDAEEVSLPFAEHVAPLALTDHPLWSPWRDELARSPVTLGLAVPGLRAPHPIDPSVDDSFAHGQIAFLDEPTWPNCGACAAPMVFCVQLAPPLLACWGLGDRGLVALLCFTCAYAHGADPRIGHVAFTTGRMRVEPPVPSLAAEHMPQSQRITAMPPRRSPVMSSWHRYRSAVRPDTAASRLFGTMAIKLAGPFPAELDPNDLDGITGNMIDEVFDEWIDVIAMDMGAWMGGVPHWDQRDRTPHCAITPAHGEMRQLLNYGGGQFLDGGLHIFSCRHPGCAHLAFVAEF